MKLISCIRKLAKWSAMVAAVLLMFAWVASSGRALRVSVYPHGDVQAVWGRIVLTQSSQSEGLWDTLTQPERFSVHVDDATMIMSLPQFEWVSGRGPRQLLFPIWLPVLLLLGPLAAGNARHAW